MITTKIDDALCILSSDGKGEVIGKLYPHRDKKGTALDPDSWIYTGDEAGETHYECALELGKEFEEAKGKDKSFGDFVDWLIERRETMPKSRLIDSDPSGAGA